MQNFWVVNKMFYGRCKNGEYVTTSLLYLFYYYFLILLFKNVRSCYIWQDFFRSESFHELLCAIVFFSNGFEINLLCSQLSLNNTSLDGQPSGVGPCHCPVI